VQQSLPRQAAAGEALRLAQAWLLLRVGWVLAPVWARPPAAALASRSVQGSVRLRAARLAPALAWSPAAGYGAHAPVWRWLRPLLPRGLPATSLPASAPRRSGDIPPGSCPRWLAGSAQTPP